MPVLQAFAFGWITVTYIFIEPAATSQDTPGHRLCVTTFTHSNYFLFIAGASFTRTRALRHIKSAFVECKVKHFC